MKVLILIFAVILTSCVSTIPARTNCGRIISIGSVSYRVYFAHRDEPIMSFYTKCPDTLKLTQVICLSKMKGR